MSRTSELYYRRRQFDTAIARFDGFGGVIATSILKEEEAYNFKDPLTIDIPESKRTKFNMTIGGKSFQMLSDRDIYKECTSKTEPTSLFSEANIRLKASPKFQFLEANRLFNKETINRGINLNQFKMLRKKKDVPIESYLFQERYE
jgi:hypothetical protein